jgi:hypothetical protein
MADKWADYLISAVRYNQAETHIEAVQVRTDDGEKVSQPSRLTRDEVIKMLGEGSTFITIYAKDGKWHRGANMKTLVVDGETWIRTDADRTKADNLGDLPRF